MRRVHIRQTPRPPRNRYRNRGVPSATSVECLHQDRILVGTRTVVATLLDRDHCSIGDPLWNTTGATGPALSPTASAWTTRTRSARRRRRCDATRAATTDHAAVEMNLFEDCSVVVVVRGNRRGAAKPRNEVSRSREVPCGAPAQPISGHDRDLESRGSARSGGGPVLF
jgi:hypothetical protein